MNSRLSAEQLIQLKESVVEDFNASNWRELGVLTNMLTQVEAHPRLLRSLSWRDPDYDGLALVFLRRMIGEDDKNLGIVQKYILEKCTNSGENISSEQKEGRKIIFKPNIFDVPADSVDYNLVSVMMPFSPNFSKTYETIQLASKCTGFTCVRADNIWDHSTVIQDIFSLIFRSFIVICDLSGKNPNVFYEAGIAHTLGKHVIPITQSEHDVAFDLQHHRHIKYLNNSEGLIELDSNLQKRLKTLSNKRDATWL